MKSAKFKAYAAFAAVFLLGAIAGGGALHAFHEREVASFVEDDSGEARERSGMSALANRLELREDQRERLRDIARRYRRERRELSRDMFERCGGPLREHKQKMNSEIRSVLDERQRLRFDEVERKARDRFPFGRRRE